MDPVFLARVQFAITIGFHYIFPTLSIGLGLILVLMEGTYLRTGNKLYERMTKFWVKVFGLTFSMGVATGIVMEFQFGTNWANYSRFVGDIFGSALAAEGIFAFFLESGFLALLLFGWNRVSPKVHFFATVMVAFGSTFSAVWIVIANSWQQTPAGFHLVGEGDKMRAEVTDFWAVVFNPSSMERLTHVLMGCYQAGAWLVLSVSAYYLLKRKHTDFAKASMKIALVIALLSSLGQLWSGHQSAQTVSQYQPAKLAAMEGHYEKESPAAMYLFGTVNEKTGEVKGLKIPGLLSFLVTGDFNAPLRGLNSFDKSERPPVNIVFQSYHLMVAIGMMLILLSFLGAFAIWRGNIEKWRGLLWIYVFTVLAPQIANQVGWATAEIGRQPWIVYGLMKTADGVSRNVPGNHILASIIMFSLIYLLLCSLFVYLLDHKIKTGPVEDVPVTGRADA
jgi:cytochrome d ubiquinol oxidase subunit I